MAVVGIGCGATLDLPLPPEKPESLPGTPESGDGQPRLTHSLPSFGRSGVSAGTAIELKFSHAVATESLVVRLTPPVPLSNGVWTEGERVVTFQPTEPLAWNMRYEMVIAGHAQSGEELEAPVIPFYTGANPDDPSTGVGGPRLVDSEPKDGATQVSSRTKLSLGFSLPMNPSSVEIGITPPVTLGAGSWSEGDTLLSFAAPELAAEIRYTVTVSGTDREGQPLVGRTQLTFTTAPNPPVAAPPAIVSASPSKGEVGVAQNRSLTVTFSKAMDRAAVEAAFVRPGGANGAFTWNAESTVLTFQPAASLGSGVTLSWGVGTGAKDVQGTALTTAFTSTFRTVGRQVERVLAAVSALEGRVNDRGVIVTAASTGAGNTTLQVGDGPAGVDRGFLTFDLGELGGQVLSVVSAELTVQQAVAPFGNPYNFLGALQVVGVDYGPSLDRDDWGRVPLATPAQNVALDGRVGAFTVDVSSNVRDDFANRASRSGRSQYRLFFRFDFQNRDTFQDAAFLWSSLTAVPAYRPSLRVRYEVP